MNLLEHLKQRKEFKVYYDGDDLGIEYNKYDPKDNYYHGIVRDRNGIEHQVGRLSIADMEKAIKDKNYFIKLENLGGN